jgi:hypothetical protein
MWPGQPAPAGQAGWPGQAAQPGQPGAWPVTSVPQQSGPFPPLPPVPQPRRSRAGRVLLIWLGIIVVVIGGSLISAKFLNKDKWKDLGTAVPSPTIVATPTPSWSQPNMFTGKSTPSQQIRYQLESWVLESAGVFAPTTSTCDDNGYTGDTSAAFTCTVTYDGSYRIQYRVSANPDGDYLIQWKAKADQIVVTRAGLLAGAYRYAHEGSTVTDLRCDGFPEIALVSTSTRLPQACYVLYSGNRKTTRLHIDPRDDGAPNFSSESQD